MLLSAHIGRPHEAHVALFPRQLNRIGRAAEQDADGDALRALAFDFFLASILVVIFFGLRFLFGHAIARRYADLTAF